MRDIFTFIKQQYENNNQVNYDYEDNISIEEKMQYLILKQRYANLGNFLEKQKEYYEEIDITGLQNLLFFYNDLKELIFIGTDLFTNTMLIKNEVPYLYRSVGKDTEKEKVLGDEKYQYKDHISKIIKECLNQIETGGKGSLFSYTKCFGKMLYKYVTLQSKESIATIEIRKCANVNSVFDGESDMSIQKYARSCANKNDKEENTLPYFSIDISNARDNKVEYLKEWVTVFLGKQDWHWHKDIVDPIGDAEVVCNFTNIVDDNKNGVLCKAVQRLDFNRDEFCRLLYKYFKTYAEKLGKSSYFDTFIDSSLKTLVGYEDGKIKEYYINTINSIVEDDDVSNILKLINWENEKKYMSRRKGEETESEVKIADISIYKGNNAEPYSAIWKEILFGAVMGKYSHIDYGYSKKENINENC